MAEQLSQSEGRPFTEFGIRQTLHRARLKFAEPLQEEVRRSLEDASPDLVEQELAELGLLSYCQPALERQLK